MLERESVAREGFYGVDGWQQIRDPVRRADAEFSEPGPSAHPQGLLRLAHAGPITVRTLNDLEQSLVVLS